MAIEHAVREWLERTAGAEPSGEGEYLMPECPWCGKARHLYVRPEKGAFVCFRCDETGPVIRLVAAVEQVTEAEANQILARIIFARPIASSADLRARVAGAAAVATQEVEPRRIPLPEGFTPCWDGVRLRLPVYLKQRGVTGAQARAHGIGWCDSGPYRGRVIVPVACCGDESWVARDVTGEAGRKYLYPQGAPQGRILACYDAAPPAPDAVVLVEGIFDALRVERAGLVGLALLGKSLGRLQRARLLRLRARRIVVMLDPDAPDAAAKVAGNIGPGAVVARVPRDPDELSDAELAQAIETARPVVVARLAGLRERLERLGRRHEEQV